MGEEKYTQKVLEAMQSAQQEAALRYHQEITSAPAGNRTGKRVREDRERKVYSLLFLLNVE